MCSLSSQRAEGNPLNGNSVHGYLLAIRMLAEAHPDVCGEGLKDSTVRLLSLCSWMMACPPVSCGIKLEFLQLLKTLRSEQPDLISLKQRMVTQAALLLQSDDLSADPMRTLMLQVH